MTDPRIGLALSGGGARGLAHITVMEALDDLGLQPAHITGSSIGAILGAVYAAGMSAKDMRREVLDIFSSRTEAAGRLMSQGSKGIGALIRPTFANPLQLDALRMITPFLEPLVPARFEDLKIPFTIVATDFYGWKPVNFEHGPLLPAVAASMAIPAMFHAVVIDDTVHVDGGIVDPLPTTQLHGRAEIIVAVDVINGPDREDSASKVPTAFEAVLGSSQLMMQTIVAERIAERPPDVLLRPNIRPFRILDFFKARAILKASEATKDEAKREVAAAIERYEKRANR